MDGKGGEKNEIKEKRKKGHLRLQRFPSVVCPPSPSPTLPSLLTAGSGCLLPLQVCSAPPSCPLPYPRVVQRLFFFKSVPLSGTQTKPASAAAAAAACMQQLNYRACSSRRPSPPGSAATRRSKIRPVILQRDKRALPAMAS